MSDGTVTEATVQGEFGQSKLHYQSDLCRIMSTYRSLDLMGKGNVWSLKEVIQDEYFTKYNYALLNKLFLWSKTGHQQSIKGNITVELKSKFNDNKEMKILNTWNNMPHFKKYNAFQSSAIKSLFCSTSEICNGSIRHLSRVIF